MKKKLLVIIPDRLSSLLQKGEVVPRYYNPGNIFDEIHIMLTNDDQPDPKLVQPMVGDAKLFIYNHPTPSGFFKKTFGWHPFLIQSWVKKAFEKIVPISPIIIRCYGMHLNLSIGSYVKEKLNLPLLVSLHTHPFLDAHRENFNLKNKIIKYFTLKLSKNLKKTDLILPVYCGILDFLEKRHIKNYQVLYNKVNACRENIKTNFDFKDNFKLICIGQQIHNKNPENLIKAVAQLKNVTLDIFGTGILNSNLKELAKSLNVNHRIKFIDSLPNAELCANLKTYDCYAACIDCIGISKTVIEAFLIKLPVLLNLNSHQQTPELNDSICLRVPDTIDGYIKGIKQLMESKKLRENLSENAYKYALENFDPEKIEKQHVAIYKQYMIS
ncbi:MAG: hypothetical protein B7Y25_00270 [Alphaproteobacteria bacterium 16-39-46]|nr:MAG: hypothetical protein B7Y25_00270 [Alphaproteobacteria bacterium 16-39-46]OZA44508.1 MAG: hypothetical protein B7X84_00050 [Alphaproteobacteria bacterium 17-39-52]HQS83355.1 glycosyltransferase [Alphaproteobacteria bacterium]HQS93042.1 glycosyltransferase [Alphaproteobacteria bacterium]